MKKLIQNKRLAIIIIYNESNKLFKQINIAYIL